MKIRIIILLLALCVCYTGCNQKKKIKIAIMTKLNQGSLIGSSEINSAKIFLESNKIDNLEIIPFNDQWKPEESLIQYQKMKKAHIDILITSHVSTCMIAIKDMINKDKTLTFITGAATNVISGQDDYLFRNIPDVVIEQKNIAEFMNKDFKNLLIIQDTVNYAYTKPALKYFKQFYKQADYKLISINIDTFDINQLEKQMSRYRFDSLYLLIGGHKVNAGSIAQLARKLRPNIPIMYTPWIKTPSLLETAGSSIKGSYIPSYYPPKKQNPEVDSYLETYMTKYGEYPATVSLNIYSALDIINQAISHGASNPDQIKSFILKQRVFKTRFGQIEFDQYGDVISPMYFISEIEEEFKK